MINLISNILPYVVIVESALASIPLIIAGKYGSALYWFSVAVVNFSAFVLIKKLG